MTHRHSVFCILPPYLLREIARRGTAEQRDAALDAWRTVGVDLPTRQLFGVEPPGDGGAAAARPRGAAPATGTPATGTP